LKVGAQLPVYLKPPNGMGMTFKPRVLKAEQTKELRWLGLLIMPGLFDGEHTLSILPLEGGHARFIQHESFTGVLVPLFTLLGLIKDTYLVFEAMNQALKAQVEGKVRHVD